MTRNRLIILLALMLVVASVAATAALVKPVNDRRSELQLTYNPDVTKNLSPEMSIALTASGSFRGLMINALWIRANNLKEEGKFYEAMELAELISTLQPRFPEVWSFLSWNMSYNISVATKTQEERWMWVNRGIELLRDKGIPSNPTSVELHKQLSWAFLHKIGQFSDDMHWYYKQQLAIEWQKVLGRPPEASTEAVLAWFAPIAEMDNRYFATDVLDRRILHQLDELSAAHPDQRLALGELSRLDPITFSRRLEELRGQTSDRLTDLHEAFDAMAQINRGTRHRSSQDPVADFLAAHPEARPAVALFRSMGQKLDYALLDRLGEVQIKLDAEASGVRLKWGEVHAAEYERLDAWMSDEDEAATRVREQLILPFLRAKVLREHYHMSGSLMMSLMEGRWLIHEAGQEPAPMPVDWRHPAAHGLYWAARGVQVGSIVGHKVKDDYFRILNTDRQVLHSIQALTHNGRIVFDPISGYYQQLPEPRYIDAYTMAMFGARQRVGGPYADSDAPMRFRAGHENFLIWSTRLCYLWGAQDKARELYAYLGREYGYDDFRKTKYSQPLDQFIFNQEMREDLTGLDDIRNFIGGYVTSALVYGYVNEQPEIANLRMQMARRMYDYYQKEQNRKTHNAGRNRMGLPPFTEIVEGVVIRFMTAPDTPANQGGVPMLVKRRAWQNLPNDLRLAVYDRIRPTLNEQVQRRSADADASFDFPPPPGIEQYRQAHPTIEMQDRQQQLRPGKGR